MTRCAALLLMAAVAAGCASSKSQFYTLSAKGAAAPATAGVGAGAAPAAAAYSVAVGPVSVPEIVDRPQFVVRLAANQVELAEQARWAEPLKSAIPRVIAANLAEILGDARISASSAGADYRVLVDIQRFESAPGDGVTIEALWSVRPAKGVAPRSGRSLVREAAAGREYDALAAAHSAALAALSRDIAEAIHASRASPQ
jgi:uncharacterized protein